VSFLGLFKPKPEPKPKVVPKHVFVINEEHYGKMAALAAKRKPGGTVTSMLTEGFALIERAERMAAEGKRLAFVNQDGTVYDYVKI
jgi:hypothetical protein